MSAVMNRSFGNIMKTVFFVLAFIMVSASASVVSAKSTSGSSSFEAGGYQAFTFINDSSESVCYIYVSPSSSSEWGDDLAPSTSCISAGEEYYLPMGGFGNEDMFDIKLEDINGNIMAELYNMDLSSVYEVSYTRNGSIVTSPPTAGNDTEFLGYEEGGYQAFTFLNNSNESVCYIYVSPSSSSEWGDDLAPPTSCIAAGEEFYVPMGHGGNEDMFDMKLEDSAGNVMAELYNIDLSVVYEIAYNSNGSITTSPSDYSSDSYGYDDGSGYQAFTFINASNESVCYIYVSPSSSSEWGNDHAPSDRCIAAGEEFYVPMGGFGNEDMFDIKLEDNYGEIMAEQYNIDLSSVYEITYSRGRITTR